MARLVLHAGMPKAGSSAVQHLLSHHAAELADHGVITAVADAAGPAGVEFRVTGDQANNSVEVVLGLRDQVRRAATLRSVEQGLRELLADHATVVVTSEALAQPFWKADKEFLGLLDRLAESHAVRVAYYVRPQHTALEAAWRQWGYRSGWPPGQYLADRARMMDYLDTHKAVTRFAPRVDFVMRPFRRDLLLGGDIAQDFLGEILEAPRIEFTPVWANRGLPLGLVNLLALTPASDLWDDEHDNTRLTALKAVLADIEVSPTAELQSSRALLQQLCHERFEPGNRVLATSAGWGDVELVPPSDVATAGRTLNDFDQLWRPALDESAIDWLQASLGQMVDRHRAMAEMRRELEATRRQLRLSEERRAAAKAAQEAAEERYARLTARKAVRAGLLLARLARPWYRH